MMKTRLIHAALFTPLSDGSWGLPILIWGPPGIAKSAAIRQVAAACGLPCKVLPPGQMGEGMFGVTPVPCLIDGKTFLTFPAPEWVRTMPARGIIFVDETNTSPPALQAAVMGLFLDRRIGDFYFAPGVRVVGAANPVQQSAGGWDLSPAQANRSAHLDWDKPSPQEFAQFLLSRYRPRQDSDRPAVNPEAEEERVLAQWPKAWSKASGLVSTLAQRKESLLHKMPSEADPNQSRAWPSHRTWEFATCAIASAEVHGLQETEADELVRAFVGQGAATELIAFQRMADLPDPGELLDGNVTFKHDPKRADRTMAVFSTCAAFVARKDCEKRKPRVGACWKLLGTVADKHADLVVPAAELLAKAQLGGVPESLPVLETVQPVLSEIDYKAPNA